MTVPYVIAIVTITCWVAANVSVILRFFARKKCSTAGLRQDDWFMCSSLLFYNGFCVTIYLLTRVESRSPALNINLANEVLLHIAVAEAIFMVTSILLKISLAFFFLPFLVEPKQRRIVIVLTAIYCAASFIAIFLALFPCGAPVNLAIKRAEGQCIPPHLWDGLLYVHGSLSALSDWCFALLPIYTLWKTRLPFAAKLSASVLMFFAVCASLCAVLRTIYTGTLRFGVQYYDPKHQPSYYKATATVINCATLELGIGITAASLACLRPLFQRCNLSKHFGSVARTARRSKVESASVLEAGVTPDVHTMSSLWDAPPSKLNRHTSLGVIPSPDHSIMGD